MWYRFRSTRYIAILVLLLGVQLGSLECRCLEHNGWVQLLLACVNSHTHHSHTHHGHTHHGHTHDSSPLEAVSNPHHDCESYHVVYQGTRRDDSFTLVNLTVFHDLTGAASRGIRPTPSNQRFNGHGSPAVAGSLACAESQVFLL